MERALADRLGPRRRRHRAPRRGARLGGRSPRSAAVYEPRPDPAEITKDEAPIRLHLPDLAALLGAPDRVDRFGIALFPASADSAVAALERSAFGYQAFPSGDRLRSRPRPFWW